MKLDYFKDKIFELLNETDEMKIRDIETNDRENKFRIELYDGSAFEVECRSCRMSSRKLPAGGRKGNMRVCWMMGSESK